MGSGSKGKLGHALHLASVQGTLFHSPEERTGRASGKNFVAATVKVRDGDAAQFWKVLAFSAEAQSELMRLDDGDALSVQGSLRA
jgi:hypothetical protein